MPGFARLPLRLAKAEPAGGAEPNRMLNILCGPLMKIINDHKCDVDEQAVNHIVIWPAQRIE